MGRALPEKRFRRKQTRVEHLGQEPVSLTSGCPFALYSLDLPLNSIMDVYQIFPVHGAYKERISTYMASPDTRNE